MFLFLNIVYSNDYDRGVNRWYKLVGLIEYQKKIQGWQVNWMFGKMVLIVQGCGFFFFLKQVCRWYIFGVCMLLVFQDLLERQFVFFAMLHFVKYVSGEDLDKSIKQIVIVFFISYLFDAFLCFSFVEIRMFCLYNIHCFLFYFLTNVQRIGNRNIR